MITKTAVLLLDSNELTKLAALNPEGVARVKDALTNIGSDFREYFLNPELNRVELCDIPYHSYQYISKLLGRPTLPEGTSGHLVMYPRSFLHEAAHHTWRIPRYYSNDEVPIENVIDNIKRFNFNFSNDKKGAFTLVPDEYMTFPGGNKYVERLIGAMAGNVPYGDSVSVPFYLLRQGINPYDVELFTTFNPSYGYVRNKAWFDNVVRVSKNNRSPKVNMPQYNNATFFNIEHPDYASLYNANPNTLVRKLDHDLTGLGDVEIKKIPSCDKGSYCLLGDI